MDRVNLFLCGDVMLARGVDMIQQQHCNPVLYEGNGLDAHAYVELAVNANGPIPPKSQRSVDYVWGDAIQILKQKNPDLRVINLETSVTTSSDRWRDKAIHYRMHPANVAVIKSAAIDCCVLANNHTADWGFNGLVETLNVLKNAGISYVGAGIDLDEAESPAIFPLPRTNDRVLIFACGHYSSGVPDKWKAMSKHPGVHIVDIHHVPKAVTHLKRIVEKYKKPGDIAVLSVHWGGNWGYDIEKYHKDFAHAVIDDAHIDVIHGHSSHHVKGLEVYQGKLIIYGCGDFINDYEGIGGHDEYRGDLALMYFVSLESGSGKLASLQMVPTQMAKLRVNRAKVEDMHWLRHSMNQECTKFGLSVIANSDAELELIFEGSFSTQL